MPLYTTTDTYGPAPLEGDSEDYLHGFAARAGLGFETGLAVTGLERGVQNYAGGAWIGHEQAVQEMKDQGYASDGIPEGGMTRGALDTIMDRQSALRVMGSQASRSNVGTVGGFVAGLVGSTPDPVNAALMVAAPAVRLPGALAASRVARAGLGAVEGGAYGAGITYGQEALGHPLGDEDVTSAENLRSILLGTAVGGGLHVAFGGHAPVIREGSTLAPGTDLTLDEVANLERTAGFANAHGIPESEVTSSAGAVGRYQVTPDTARAMGLKGTDEEVTEQLKNPAVNQEIAGKYLGQLADRYPGDPEAQAVAYNAGPGRANRYIASGRNATAIPGQTQDYLFRFRDMRGGARIEPQGEISQAVDQLPPQTRADVAQTAVAQFASDSQVNVDPVLARSVLENSPEGESRPLYAGASSDIGTQQLSEAYLGRFGGETMDIPQPGEDAPWRHQQADWADNLPALKQAGPASPISMRETVLRAASRGLLDLDSAPLLDAVPKPGSILTEDPALGDRLTGMANVFGDQGRPSGLEAETTDATNTAIREAQALAPHTDEGLREGMASAFADHNEQMGEARDFVKAVTAAVRCGLAKGFS